MSNFLKVVEEAKREFVDKCANAVKEWSDIIEFEEELGTDGEPLTYWTAFSEISCVPYEEQIYSILVSRFFKEVADFMDNTSEIFYNTDDLKKACKIAYGEDEDWERIVDKMEYEDMIVYEENEEGDYYIKHDMGRIKYDY